MAIAVRGSVWDPFTALVRQMDDFDSIVRRAFGGGSGGTTTGFVPAADVTRQGGDVLITLELPGVDAAEDVDVEVLRNRLVISGHRAEQTKAEQDGVLVRELRSGAFRREFALPEGVSADQIDAEYDRGLLRVRVRDVVRPADRPTKVAVRTADRPAIVDTGGSGQE
ncbi:Hsp20/alpha crystallin family protein [Goodfellowiella coeruleoviolacea]|uniref:HSP20 family protein n=1 Tax=Goodfellowiella coeruleoviolacea TaxID=334858 RepID=A0AAE3KFF6_9PSEU|nr:Hsp20/alpha crystallin family protein [Goodfellowiella coeruleoviolacea]MCP2164374.1 HSP20 family protein [Goodfellowiella coeruleoviolacea]